MKNYRTQTLTQKMWATLKGIFSLQKKYHFKLIYNSKKVNLGRKISRAKSYVLIIVSFDF